MPLFRYDIDVLLNAPSYAALAACNIYVCSQPSNANQTDPSITPIPPAPLANICADSSGTPLQNPVQTDEYGHAYFYVLPNTYDVVINDPYDRLATTMVRIDQNIGVAAGGGGLAFETNGTPNANQALLNVAQGAGITAV